MQYTLLSDAAEQKGLTALQLLSECIETENVYFRSKGIISINIERIGEFSINAQFIKVPDDSLQHLQIYETTEITGFGSLAQFEKVFIGIGDYFPDWEATSRSAGRVVFHYAIEIHRDQLLVEKQSIGQAQSSVKETIGAPVIEAKDRPELIMEHLKKEYTDVFNIPHGDLINVVFPWYDGSFNKGKSSFQKDLDILRADNRFSSAAKTRK